MILKVIKEVVLKTCPSLRQVNFNQSESLHGPLFCDPTKDTET